MTIPQRNGKKRSPWETDGWGLVFGKTSNERIQLNDDSMWPGDDGWDEPEGNEKDLEQIRELLFQGKNAEADKLLVEKFSCKKIVRSHQTIGDLYIDFQHDSISDYRLELDIGPTTTTEGSNLLVMRGEVTQRDAVFNSDGHSPNR